MISEYKYFENSAAERNTCSFATATSWSVIEKSKYVEKFMFSLRGGESDSLNFIFWNKTKSTLVGQTPPPLSALIVI